MTAGQDTRGSARFVRSSRLLKPAEFAQTFSGGRRLTQKPIGMVYAANPHGKARLGLAISKKALPLAVDRNRIKRIVRDEFRRASASLPAVDIVVYLQPDKRKLEASEAHKILVQLWNRVIERCKPC